MSTNHSLIVETQCGLVQGVAEGNIQAFRGLRYAEPPLRFQPPQPLKAWAGIFKADQFGPAAPQPAPLAYNPLQDEDCLTLNVWTSGTEEPVRPVLLYIHGGGFVTGSGSNPFYNGRTFAENGDIVVVTVNYRLGVLGFLDLHDALGEDYRSSGNCGLLDLIEALRWVQSNISRFGGDPSRITVMGQSAGAKCIGGLLHSPLAEGLFHQAIAISGAVQAIRDRTTSAVVTRRFMDFLGLPPQSAGKLLEMSVFDLMSVQQAWVRDLRGVHLFGPVIDGAVMDTPPLKGLPRTSGRPLPVLLIGTTRNETAGFIAESAVMQKPDDELLTSIFGCNAGAVKLAYQRLSGRTLEQETDLAAWESVLTDYMYRIAAIRTADAYSAAGAPVWLYRFDRTGAGGSAAHGGERTFVWHNGFPPHETALADRVHHMWISFIRTGSPQAAAPEWRRYEAKERLFLILDHECAIDNLQAFCDDPGFSDQVFTLK